MIRQAALVFLFYAILAGSADCLTMDEAVERALANNHQIRQFTHLESSSREGVGVARSKFFPSLGVNYAYTESNENIFFSDKKSTQYTVAAAYTLFNGFSDLKGLHEAKSQAKASLYQKKSVVSDVVLSVRSAYIEVLRAERLEETARESVELLERQVRDSSVYYREGLIAKNELLKVQVELASARQELLQAEGNRRIALKQLERAMGAALEEDEKIQDIVRVPGISDLSFDALKEEMLASRSELKYLLAVRDARKHAKESIRGGYLPSVDLEVSYNKRDTSGISGVTGSSYDEDIRGVISAGWNLFSGFETSRSAKRAEYLVRATEEEIKETEEELLFQLREALEEYAISEGKLMVAETAVSQAEENYRVTESQFRERVATGTDLLDARSFLTRAKNQYNNALYDIHLSAARIERVLERGY